MVAKLNGGNHTVGWPLAIIVLPYQPFYRALDHAPKLIFRAWEKYDTFFWGLGNEALAANATRPPRFSGQLSAVGSRPGRKLAYGAGVILSLAVVAASPTASRID